MNFLDKVKKAGSKIVDGVGEAVDELKADDPTQMMIGIERYEELIEVERRFKEMLEGSYNTKVAPEEEI